MDPLASAALEAERYADRQGWGKRPVLFALARKGQIQPANPKAEAILRGRRDDELIPIEQDPLPSGEPEEVLAGIRWGEDVEGCVLTTEILVLPPETKAKSPSDPAELERWADSQPGREQARLAVGVLRSGDYTCCLRLKGQEELIVIPDMADDIVTALLGTFVPAEGKAPIP